MKIRPIGPNQTELIIEGVGAIFFSYQTPVAANLSGTLYKTTKKWSTTTSKHINKWLAGERADEMPQDFFDSLLSKCGYRM